MFPHFGNILYIYIYSSSLSHFQCTKPLTMEQWTVIKTGNKRRQSKTIYMQTRSFRCSNSVSMILLPHFTIQLSASEINPGKIYRARWQTIFQKIFKKPSYFIWRQWRQPVGKRDSGKNERGRGKRGRKNKKKKKEEKKQEGKNEQKISPLLTYRIILPISPQRAPTSRVRSNERSYRRGLHCAAGVQQ